MGMFDCITCKYPLGVKEQNFQTKSLVNGLRNFEIREDGTLWHEEYDAEDHSDPNATGAARIFGMGMPANHKWVKYNYTGEIRFYTDSNLDPNGKSSWIEFISFFKDGQLLDCQRDESTEDKLNSL